MTRPKIRVTDFRLSRQKTTTLRVQFYAYVVERVARRSLIRSDDGQQKSAAGKAAVEGLRNLGVIDVMIMVMRNGAHWQRLEVPLKD